MGCGLSSPVLPTTLMDQGQKYIPKGLISAIKENSQLIVAYADTNSDQKQNLMNCFQFFELNAKYLWRIAMDKNQINKSIKVVLNCLEPLLEVLPIYIISDMMYALYICRILSSYSMILFQFYATNGKRFMEVDSSIKYLKMIKVIEQQLLIERENDPLNNNIECQLFQIKAAITIAPTDATEGEEILKQFFGGALKAGLTFTLNDDLIESLQKGVKYIYNEYQQSQFKRKFKLIYYITGLKYSIIEEIEQQKEALDILKRMTDFYQKIIKECDDWEVKCCWIQSISQIINHKISLTQNQIQDISGNTPIYNQFLVKIKEQFFVSINNEDLKNQTYAKQLFYQLKPLNSLSRIQYELIKGNQELNGFEKWYKLKINAQKQDKYQIIDMSKLNNIIKYIEIITIQQNTLINKLNGENQYLDPIIESLIDNTFQLQSGIKEISKLKDKIYQKINPLQIDQFQSDDQYICTIYYLCDVMLIQDQELSQAKFFKEKLALILKDNKHSYSELSKNDKEGQMLSLQEKLKSKIDKYQRQVDKESILRDLHYILIVIDEYKELLNYNMIQLQYLQIGKTIDFQVKYDYEGLQKIIEQLQKIIQIAESDRQFKKIQLEQTSEIKALLSQLIVGKTNYFNSKITNLLQVFNEPNAIQLIQKLSEFILIHFKQLIKDLKMIIDAMKHESDTQIQKKGLNDDVISELLSCLEGESLLQPDKLLSISYKLKMYVEQIKQSKITYVKDQILSLQSTQDKLIDMQKLQIINQNDQKNYENCILYLKIAVKKEIESHQNQFKIINTNQVEEQFDCEKESELFKSIVIDLEKFENQQNRNIEVIQEYLKLLECFKIYSENLKIYQKYQQQQTNQNLEEQIIKCQQFLKMNLTINIAELCDKIASNTYSQYPKELEQLIIFKLKSIDQSRYSTFKQTFFTNNFQLIEDTMNNDQWRIRQTIIYELLSMDSNLLLVSTAQINRGLLVKLQIYETDPRIKKFFENPQHLQQQNLLMKQYWPTVEEQVQETIKDKLQSLSLLSTEISREKNDYEKQRKQKQYKVLQQEISDQIQNIQSITSSLGITVLFLQDLKLDLARMENTLNQIQQSVNSMGQDLKALIGRTFQELLEIRMKSILSPQSPLSNIQEQNKNTQEEQEHVYIPIKAKEKNYQTEIEDEETNLFSDDLLGTGLVNEFIRKQNRDSLLIHGMAGSGKSTAARKIEQFLWKKFEMNMNQTDFISVVPIFISLPQLKDPIYSAVEDTLKSDNYRFSDKQVQEFKEAVQSGQYRVLFIMDSYDELKQEYLGSNINISNTISKWRCPNDKGRYPKVITTSRTELFATKGYFNWFISESNNINVFQEVRLVEFNDSQIQQYIKEYYLMEILKIIRQFSQISDPIEFKQQWSLNRKNPQIERFVQKEHQKKVEELLSQLWKPETFTSKIEDLQLQVLLTTPYMMEMVVFLLPMMVNKISNVDSIKNQFINRYPRKNDTKAIEALDAWQFIIQNSEFMVEYQKSVVKSQKQMEQTVHRYFNTQQNYIAIKQALVLEPLTSYDFYSEFFDNYFNREIQKLKEQGKTSDIKDELWEFAHKLSNQMTFNNLSQVPFQRSGLVFKKMEKDWKDDFFDDDCPEGEYKKQFRKCIPLNQKNGVFSFNHKSLQEFLVARQLIQNIDQLEKEPFFTQNNWDQEYLKGVIGFVVDKVKYSEVIQRKLFNMLLNTKNNTLKLNIENMDKEMEKTNRQLIQAGSNSMFILYQSDYNFRHQDLSQIYIKDINLAGINFFRTQLVGSTFKNVNLSQSKLNYADLTECKWDSIHINERPTIQSNKRQYKNLVFLNNSEKILCLYGSSDVRKIQEWDCSNATRVRTLSYKKLRIKRIAISIQDQSNLIALVDNETIYIFDTILDKMTHQLEYNDLDIAIKHLTFSWEDRSLIFISYSDGLCKFNFPQCQLTEQKQIQQIKLTTEQIEKIIDGDINKIGTSRKYILANNSESFWIYDSQNGYLLPQVICDNIVESGFRVCISIDGQMIAIASKKIFLYQIDKLETPKLLGRNDGDESINYMAFQKNKYLVSARDTSITVWDLLTSTQVNNFNVDARISQIALNSESMLLAVGLYEGGIKLYNIEEYQKLSIKSQGHDRKIKFCVFSNNGLLLVSGDDQYLKLWDLSIGKQMGKNMLLSGDKSSKLFREFINQDRFFWPGEKFSKLYLEFTKNDEFIFSIRNFSQIDQWNVSNQMKIKSFDIDISIIIKPKNMIDQLLIDQNQIIRIDALYIELWDLSQKTCKTFEYSQNMQENCVFTLQAQQHITAILSTKDETVLGTNDGQLIFLNENNEQSSIAKFHTSQIIKVMDLKDDNCYVSAGLDNKIVISKLGIQQHSYQTDNPINDIVLFKDQIICCDSKIIIYKIYSDEGPRYFDQNGYINQKVTWIQISKPKKEKAQKIENIENFTKILIVESTFDDYQDSAFSLELDTYVYAGTDLGMVFTWKGFDSRADKLKVSEYKITQLKYNQQCKNLIASSQDGNIYVIEQNEVKRKIQTENPILFMEISKKNSIILGNDNKTFSPKNFGTQNNIIITFEQFQKLTAMTISFDERKILVSDKNQLIQIGLQYITCSSFNKNKTFLLIGYDSGQVIQYNLDGTAISSWQGQTKTIDKIIQYEELVLVMYNEQIMLMNWNKKEIIYEKESYHIKFCNFINENCLIYFDEKFLSKLDLVSNQITEIRSGTSDILGTCISKDHFISWDENCQIRVYEIQSLAPKFIFSMAQKLECDLAVYQDSTYIRTASGIDMKALFQQKGAKLQE